MKSFFALSFLRVLPNQGAFLIYWLDRTFNSLYFAPFVLFAFFLHDFNHVFIDYHHFEIKICL